jgi:putative transposase
MVEEDKSPHRREWPHAPPHLFLPAATYFITAGTYRKQHFFRQPDRLEVLQASLFEHAEEFGWRLEAWAFFSNHYHIVAQAPEDAKSLSPMLQSLHSKTAVYVNALDATPARKVWWQHRDTCLTYEKSYLARLHYVHNNPVHHGLVPIAENYRWCSMRWFVREAKPGFRRTVLSFKIDRLNIPDDF